MAREEEPVWTLSPRDLRESMARKTAAALSEVFAEIAEKPIYAGHSTYKVRVHNVRVGALPAENDYTAERKSRLGRKTYGAPLLADVVVEKNGKVIDSYKSRRIGVLPTATDRFSFLVAAPRKETSEVHMTHLMRRRHGLYTRQGDDGRVTTEVVTGRQGIRSKDDPGVGHRRTFGLAVNDTGEILFRVMGKSVPRKNGRVPLIPILHAMGMDDEAIAERLGAAAFKVNQAHWKGYQKKAKLPPESATESVLERLHDVIYGPSEEAAAKKRRRVLEGIKEMELDPVTSRTILGKPHATMSANALAAAASNLLAVSRGERDADEQISLAYQKVVGPDDLLADFLRKPETKRSILSKITQKLSRMARTEDSGKTVHRARDILAQTVGPQIDNFFLNSKVNDLASPGGMNPLAILGEATKITPLNEGLGGLGSERHVKATQKLVHPSHLGFLDPVQTPEGGRSGITLHMTIGTKRSTQDGTGVIQADMWDVRKRHLRPTTPAEVQDAVIGFPDQYTWEKGVPKPVATLVKAQKGKKMLRVKPDEVDLIVPQSSRLFSVAANLVPFTESNHGNRLMMAARQMPQAVSLVEREAPLVQVATPNGGSFEESFGKAYAAVSAPVSGRITEVHKDDKENEAWVTIKPFLGKARRVPLYMHYPLSERGQLHSEPVVKVGDEVKVGDLIADSNYTKGGALALGKNMFVAYMPWKGKTFDDGIVISETASKALTSRHLYDETIDLVPEDQDIHPEVFSALYKDRLPKSRVAAYTRNGVIRKGETLQPGDPITTAITKGSTDLLGAQKGTGKTDVRQNVSRYWKGSHPARVVDVIEEKGRHNGKTVLRYKVLLETLEPAEVGDKITNRAAAKGVITQVVPDAEMPRTKEGKVVDVLMNPAGLPGRMNVGQVLEAGLAKVVEKVRKDKNDPTYVERVASFSGRNNVQWVLDRLKAAGLSDQETLINPKTNRPYGEDATILAGPQYILKLKHQVDKKVVSRNAGKVSPTTGTPTGDARRLGELNFYSMLAHGARANLREMATIKSGGPGRPGDTLGIDAWNQAVYSAITDGSPIPKPRGRNPVWDEFESYLNAMGVRLDDNGERVQVTPLTDAQARKMSHGELSTRVGTPAEFKRHHGVVEAPGAMYDPAITGGRFGENWSHYELENRIPKPIYATAVGLLLGLGKSKNGSDSDKAIREILAGERELDGKTGAEAIVSALGKIDVKAELKKSLEVVRNKESKVATRDVHSRRVRVLRALESFGVSPVEAYTTKLLPVVPPKFRPLREQDGLAKNPLNRFYGDVAAELESVKSLKAEFRDAGVTEDELMALPDVRESDASVYEALKAFDGLTSGGFTYWKSGGYIDPEDKGLMARITGPQPKRSYFQENILKRRQDFSAGSVITPNPDLGLDQIGVPEAVAWDLYEPHVIRRLRQAGSAKSFAEARAHINKRTQVAEMHLRAEMARRPVLFKRDPTLHKYGIMAFEPKLVVEREEGKTAKAIQLHPLVTAPLNADFDGDQGTLYLPLTEDARIESYKMMPSRNLFGPATGLPMFVPSQEALLGLNMLSKAGRKTGKSFATKDEATRAFHKGELKMDDVIHVGKLQTTPGRLVLDSVLPPKYQQFGKVPFDEQRVYDKGSLRNFLTQVGREDPEDFAAVADRLKDLGYKYSTDGGFSVSLEDLLVVNKDLRDVIEKDSLAKEEKIWADTKLTQDEKERAVVLLYRKVDAALEMDPKVGKGPNAKAFAESDNRLFRMIRTGSKGSTLAVQQMVSAPVLVMSADNKTIPAPILRSYGEGLDTSGYMTAVHGARKGVIQKVQQVQDPGMVSKFIMKATMDMLISERDCGTHKGIDLPLGRGKSSTPNDLRGRYLASNGNPVTNKMISDLQARGVETLKVRSPMACESKRGICAKCAGNNENGVLMEDGENIGVISGQSIGEPLTQLSMRVFHTGGLAKGKEAGTQDMFAKLQALVSLPKGTLIPNETKISPISGKITDVDPLVAGGWRMTITPKDGGPSRTEYLRRGTDLSEDPDADDLMVDRQPLTVGTEIEAGDRLSYTGSVHPGRLLEITGDLPSVQDLMVDEMHSTMIQGANENLLRRHTEVLVRALTDRWEVTDGGTHPTLLPGDMVRSGDIKDAVKASNGSLKLQPRVLSANKVPHASEDWMVRLQSTELKQGLLDAAQYGQESFVNGFHPVPGYGYGLRFAQGPSPGY